MQRKGKHSFKSIIRVYLDIRNMSFFLPRLIFDTANKAMIMGLMAYFSAQVPDPKND